LPRSSYPVGLVDIGDGGARRATVNRPRLEKITSHTPGRPWLRKRRRSVPLVNLSTRLLRGTGPAGRRRGHGAKLRGEAV